MTRETRAANGQQPAPEDGGMPAQLAEVQRHTVELLSRLGRPPSNVRIQAGDITLDITWGGEPVAPVESAESPAETESAAEYLTSPGVGTFYHAPEPGAEPFVSVGSIVRPGQQVGIIEAMKLMMPVEADRAGRIAEVLKPNGEPVEFDEPLFAIAAEEG
jgi:acetyl-CoA carboxylase biotin carboxyl carrier protein